MRKTEDSSRIDGSIHVECCTIRAVNSLRTRGWRIRREDSVAVIRKRRRQSRVPGRNVMKAIPGGSGGSAPLRLLLFSCVWRICGQRNKATGRYIDSFVGIKNGKRVHRVFVNRILWWKRVWCLVLIRRVISKSFPRGITLKKLVFASSLLWWKNCVELCDFNFAHGQYRIVARRIISKGISVIKLIFFFDGGDFDRVFVLDNIVARGIRKRTLVKY